MANGMNVPCQESGKKLKENCNSEGKPWAIVLRIQSAKQSFVEFMLKCRFSGKILMVWPRNLHLSHDSGASGPWSSPWRNTASEGWNRGMSRATLWAWSFRPVGPQKSSQMLETAVTQRVYPALGRKRSDKKGVDCTLKMSNNANSFDGEFG